MHDFFIILFADQLSLLLSSEIYFYFYFLACNTYGVTWTIQFYASMTMIFCRRDKHSERERERERERDLPMTV